MFQNLIINSYFSIADLENYNEEYDNGETNLKQQIMDTMDLIQSTSNNDYILKIRNRIQEDAQSRKEREKRRRKVLVDQLKATESLEVSFNVFPKFIFNNNFLILKK